MPADGVPGRYVGIPRPTVSPNTQSVGFSTRLVVINAITPDGLTAICTDLRNATEVRVPMLFQRSKGALPAVGEKWLVSQDITDSYSFAAIMSSSAAPFTSPVVSNGSVGSGGSGSGEGIPGGAIAPGSITGLQIAPQSLSALNLAAAAFGTNIILDPQFTNAEINAARLSDRQTHGTWNIASPSAAASGTALCTLALMPSVLVPLYVNPGEQYYLSVQASLSAGSNVTAGIQFVFDNGSFDGPGPVLTPGANTIAQLVTIPPGVAAAYVRIFAQGLTGSGKVTFSSPVCYITQGPNQLQPSSVTANSIAAGAVTANSVAANAITANAIAANAITAAAIAAGAVTANAIAANTIVAGIVNGTTISGAQFIAYGANGEVLVYAGPPAAGNLIASISATGGTDQYGNAYQAGSATYSGSSYSQLTSGVLNFKGTASQFSPSVIQTQNLAGYLDLQSGQVTATDTIAEIFLESNRAAGNTGSTIALNADVVAFSGSNFQISSGQISVAPGAGPFINGEGWHTVTLTLASGNGTLNTEIARVKLLPWNGVWFDFYGTVTLGSAATEYTGTVPGNSYFPLNNRTFPVGLGDTPSGITGSGGFPRVFIDTSGNVNVWFPSGSGSGGTIGCSLIYPTN